VKDVTLKDAFFVIPGEPVAKGRPRFRVAGNYAQAYTPKNTVMYENLVAVEYERQCPGVRFEDDEAVAMFIALYYGIPKSASKAKKKLMEDNMIHPITKRDVDHVAKSIMDGLQGVAYKDDKQIATLVVTKQYGNEPRAEVELVLM
jgi:Holliday junction resolvase RusA-like endonuclease